MMRPWPWISGILPWYAFWLLAITILYWPGIIQLPQLDQAVFMLGRDLVGNDRQWFVDVLSYNRTRLLQPGDYIAFRPLHMAVIALEDILLRNYYAAQGVFGCTLFAVTATSLFYLTRRLAGISAGFALTLLWVSQLAGSKILLWQHITPYVLIPAFFSIALLLLGDTPVSSRRALLAGVLVTAATLGHELGVLIAAAIPVVMLVLQLSGRGHFGRLYPVFLIPAAVSMLLNLLDYFVVHPPPFLVEPVCAVTVEKIKELPTGLFEYAAAVGTAFFIPSAVHVDMLSNGFFVWDFLEGSHAALIIGGIILALLISTVIWRMVSAVDRSGDRPDKLAIYFFLTMFFGIFTVCAFRIVTHGLDYMYGANYYYSLFSYALCGMTAYVLSTSPGAAGKTVVSGILLLACWHAVTMHMYLREISPLNRQRAAIIRNVRTAIINNPEACFAGTDIVSVPPMTWELTPLFSDLACTVRRGDLHLYLSDSAGLPVLSTIEYAEPVSRYSIAAVSGASGYFSYDRLPYGHPFEFTLQRSGAFRLLITGSSGRASGFIIEYNVVHTMGENRRFDSSNALIFNAAAGPAVYRVRFADNALLLFVNDQFAGSTARIAENGEAVRLELSAHDGKPMVLTELKISDSVLTGTKEVVPRYSGL